MLNLFPKTEKTRMGIWKRGSTAGIDLRNVLNLKLKLSRLDSPLLVYHRKIGLYLWNIQSLS